MKPIKIVNGIARYWGPGFFHSRYFEPERLRFEYLKAADCFRATLWLYWTWKGQGHYLLISLPDIIP